MENGSKTYDEEQLKRFQQGWCDFMIDVWHDRIMQLHIHDTGALLKSVRGEVSTGTPTIITHKFLEYGVYVAAGVGNGYRRGNSGKDDEFGLQFLRGEKGRKGKHRTRRDWFAKKYFYSVKRLNEKTAEFYGEAYRGLTVTALDDMFDRHSTLRSL